MEFPNIVRAVAYSIAEHGVTPVVKSLGNSRTYLTFKSRMLYFVQNLRNAPRTRRGFEILCGINYEGLVLELEDRLREAEKRGRFDEVAKEIVDEAIRMAKA